MEIARFNFGREATVALWGPDYTDGVRELAVQYGAQPDLVCWIKAASSERDLGFGQIRQPWYGTPDCKEPDVVSDGVILKHSKSAAIIEPGDCPIALLYEVITRQLLVVHAGRAALTPNNKPGEPINNIITTAFSQLTGGRGTHYIIAYITGAICPRCFRHDTLESEKLIKPFDQFGETAFLNRTHGQLDLVNIIKTQLKSLGVPSKRIYTDGLCTYEDKRLASYRRDRSSSRNAVVTVLH